MDAFLDRYRIEGKLGEGGMGVVWRAHDPNLRRDVALKVLPDPLVADAEARARLLREARAAAALNHPNILTIYDVGEADGHVYIAMEYVPGRPLSGVIGDTGVRAAEALRLGQQIAAGLAHAHARGIVHRDVKPSNVLVTPSGDCKVLDFGIATRQASELTATQSMNLTAPGALVGTPTAMAPELWRGAPADTRSDVWAFGALLQTLLTGRGPFPGDHPYQVASAISNSEPTPLPQSVPPALAAVVARCLDREPARRYQSAAEVQAALQAIEATSGAALGVQRPGAAAGAAGARLGRAAAIAGAVVVLAVAAIVLAPRWRAHRGSIGGEPIRSLAVLPLENFSHDPQQQYFADAMTDELITRLAQLGVVRVISRTSAVRFRGATLALPEIARQLGVDAIVEGSVAQSGGRVRITAQLMRAATDEHLWARSYEREIGDALTLQDEVAGEIAREVGGALAPAKPPASGSTPAGPGGGDAAGHAAAVQAYLRGRDQFQHWTSAGAHRAIEYFDQALALDPSLAQAEAARASALLFVSASPETTALARAAIDRVLARHPEIGETHAAHARLLFENDWNWPLAEREFKRAIELNPNDADAHHQYSHLLVALGRLDEAREQARLMLSLDPLAPASHDHLGWLEYECGNFDRARAADRRALELDPGYVVALLQLADVELVTRRWPAYRQVLDEARRAGAEVDPALIALSDDAERGRREPALRLVREIASPRDTFTHVFTQLARWCAVLGSANDAFATLDSAYTTRDYELLFLNVDPGFASVRSDPRYAALRRRMRLPL